jgi:hypothetical protein
VTDLDSRERPDWSDVFFDADLPDGTSMDFELCTADTAAGLNSCVWSTSMNNKKKITVKGRGTCVANSDCQNVAGFGNGYCSEYGTCHFITEAKVTAEYKCPAQACPNGPSGPGNAEIATYCDTSTSRCVYTSQPGDVGETLPEGDNQKPYSRVRVTLRADDKAIRTPTLYSWYLTYYCLAVQ